MKDKLEQFIKNNKLKFTVGRRNSDCVIICGYTQYLNGLVKYEDEDGEQELCDALEPYTSRDSELDSELGRVWDYTEDNNYSAWWKKEANKKEYILA